MWLLPVFSMVAGASARVYYRLRIAGDPIPRRGPALLVANHPNSLLDPVLVAAAAGRPVRFLAKAPLFADGKIGWLVRGAGAIPVYRQADDPQAMGGNVDMFRAVHRELSRGAAIGMFPEGVSHSGPALTKLKTGAARMALGTLASYPHPFPIVPMGLVFEAKDVFRSRALVVRGQRVDWDDLSHARADDREAVQELTRRIDAAMRRVTLNLEAWEDGPLVECTERIWTAERRADRDPVERMSRLEVITTGLGRVRRASDAADSTLVNDVAAHCRRLRRLGLMPRDLSRDTRVTTGVRWAARRVYLVSLPALTTATAGYLAFWPPYRLTDALTSAAKPDPDQRATYKLLIGIVAYAMWIGAVGFAVGLVGGVAWGAGAAAALPAIGLLGLWARERWKGAWRDVWRFMLLRSRQAAVEDLRQQQARLADRLEELGGRW